MGKKYQHTEMMLNDTGLLMKPTTETNGKAELARNGFLRGGYLASIPHMKERTLIQSSVNRRVAGVKIGVEICGFVGVGHVCLHQAN